MITSFAGFYCGCGTVQLHFDDAYNSRAFRLRVHGRQRGHLRHLPQEFGHWSAHIHQLESTDGANSVVNYGQFEVRWGVECGLDGVPNQPGSLSSNTFSSRHLRPSYLG